MCSFPQLASVPVCQINNNKECRTHQALSNHVIMSRVEVTQFPASANTSILGRRMQEQKHPWWDGMPRQSSEIVPVVTHRASTVLCGEQGDPEIRLWSTNHIQSNWFTNPKDLWCDISSGRGMSQPVSTNMQQGQGQGQGQGQVLRIGAANVAN